MVQKLKGKLSWRWDKLSRHYRRFHPLCELCSAEGRVAAAEVVDHKTPHRGNEQLLFAIDNLQSLCKRCHDSRKQFVERRGYDNTIGVDGWPVHASHPANKENKNFISRGDSKC